MLPGIAHEFDLVEKQCCGDLHPAAQIADHTLHQPVHEHGRVSGKLHQRRLVQLHQLVVGGVAQHLPRHAIR
ncbi:hypothetical protein [Lentzea kristufekii]|uniref:hypothetical protein n=1 Tax=Lentzea kristufekii TaxID=3095430 RepID=UPI003873BED4